jgi:hypothetical protein
MNVKNRCVLLADKIEEILRDGLTLSQDVVHYIDSTFSRPSVGQLEEIIGDESNCERDSLLELIFFPDESIQIRLEDFLEKEDFQKADEETVAGILSSRQPATTIHFPDERGSLKVRISNSAAEQLVSRLHISRRSDGSLIDAIDNHVNEKIKNQVKVRLRNTRIEHTGNRAIFMCSFFEKMNSKGVDFFETLSFILGFLDEIQDDSDIYRPLMNKKIFYMRNIEKAKKFEDQRQKGNMETLFAQGVRMPYIDKNDMQKKMRTIDRISFAVFGKTEFIDQVVGSVDLGQFDGDEDVKKVIDLLS